MRLIVWQQPGETNHHALPRFTRLTNGDSKTDQQHTAMQAIFFAWYNFARKHEALKGQTPAMASRLANNVWSLRELLEHAASV